MELTRQDKILKMIVELFIKTAQPVGSHSLIEQYGLSLSSATIRNEMNALEKAGFLEKTHTSSGRVPSSKGYRYYVDNLREDSVDERLKYQIQAVLSEKVKSVEDVINESCEILSHMTNLASIVLGPDVMAEHLVSLQVIPLNDKTVTAVFVTDRGYVENKTFILSDSIQVNDLVNCVRIVSDRIKGTPVSDLVEKMESLKPIISEYAIDSNIVYQTMVEAFIRFAGERLSLYGKEQIFETPEFKQDADKLRAIIDMLDSPKALKEAVGQVKDDVTVQIGGSKKGLSDVAIISGKINISSNNEGTIALVGPTRMDYDRVVAAITYVCQELDKYFNERNREKNWKKKKENLNKKNNQTNTNKTNQKTKK